MKKLLTLLSLFISAHFLNAQVNGFATVSTISGATLGITSVDETYDTFEIGENVIIMQIQDDVIGANTGNNANFGDLSTISSAGLYEVREIVDITEILGRPIVIELSPSLTNTYNISFNSLVQVITFPVLGGGSDFATTGNINTMGWNGLVGGITAFEVQGKLTIGHNINANGDGFRGGEADDWWSFGCEPGTYRFSSTAFGTAGYAEKGEGIYRITSNNYRDARGKILNGGGGGNEHNAGGAGGGNYTAGGNAGPGYGCGTNAGGIGGLGLSAQISASRIFLGGGGGGGEGNTSNSTDGADGGGIIIIKALEITTSGSCAAHVISANGNAAGNSGEDGAGGGGAGGSIIIDCPSFDISSSCDLTISANGGNGGAVNDATSHGGGGGGGQGAVIFSSSVPVDVSVQTVNGGGGCNNNSNPCNSIASGGGGSNGSGVQGSQSGPLPIELLSFQAIPTQTKVNLHWTTASELNNDFFTIERSKYGEIWEEVRTISGAGDSQTTMNYQTLDEEPIDGISYYRLKQTDYDGTSTYSDIRSVNYAQGSVTVEIYPNPANDLLNLSSSVELEQGSVRLHNGVGQLIALDIQHGGNRAQLDVSNLHPGPYFVVIRTRNEVIKRKVMVE